jgi:hypothetical protein|tara:strand:- start:2369 stop:3256 length:888 start_codon:yes stop_codon:yes gene_type:complete
VIRNRGLGVAPIPEGIERVDKFTPEFLEDIDVVLFFETPFHTSIVKQAKEAGKRVVCIPMLEWTPDWKKPNKNWIKFVDLFICPTQHCFEVLGEEGYPCSVFIWPYDLERFRYTPSSLCHQFLFIEGNGGFLGRKGASVVKKAKELWPELPLIVKTQRSPNLWPKNTLFVNPGMNNLSLYSQGDVLIYPGKCDGIGLQPHEAMVSGMPVIVTDGKPWDEQPALARINSIHSHKRIAPGRDMDWYEADPVHLVEICKSLIGRPVSVEAKTGRAWAESISWKNRGESLTRMILTGEV